MKVSFSKAAFTEVCKVSEFITDVKDLDVITVGALLVAAKETNNLELLEKCLDRLMCDSQTRSAMKYLLNKMYGRYGVDELMYLYQEFSYKEFYEMLTPLCRNVWMELTWNYVSTHLSDTRDVRGNYFVHHFLKLRLTGAYCKLICTLAKDRFPTLTFSALRRYIKMRKETNYQFSFSKCSNAEAMELFKQYGVGDICSEETLNKYRIMFGHEAEESSIPLQERPEWKTAHRNEILFWKRTQANLITEEQQVQMLSQVEEEMDYTDEEIADLRNWMMIARYEGRAADDLTVCDTLRERYEGGTCKSVIKKMRIDILRHCDLTAFDPVLVSTLLASIGGKAKNEISKRI